MTSSPAIANLTASTATLESDPLLCLIAHLASSLQLTVTVKKKGSGLSLTTGSSTLTQRNAVLRSLCGMALHNALDAAGHAFLGGHSAGCTAVPASPAHALAMAGISSWMSVASSVRDNHGGAASPEKIEALLSQLDAYLAGRAFLVSSSNATLADLDLYLAIVSAAGQALGELLGTKGGNAAVRRWLEQCHATLECLAARANNGKLPPVKLPELALPVIPDVVPLFFYGEEGDDALAATAAISPLAAQAHVKGGSEGKKHEISKGSGAAAAKGGGGELTDEQKKAAADKRAKKTTEKAAKKKAKQPAQGGAQAGSGEMDISALDIRVGKIVKAWNHETADKLYCEEVDVGEEGGPRKIASGLRPFYKLEEMQNRDVLVLCNLKARNLVGFPSHGMVLCASNSDHTAVEFAIPPEGAKIGERVVFGEFNGKPEPENKVAKKKYFEKLAPDLKTDGEGNVTWKGAKAMTSAGQCRAVNGMADAQVS